jgi:prepilin-type N-terminal cleavage/methylation domain-containing protein
MTLRSRASVRSGFTLIELLLVIAILAGLAGVSLGYFRNAAREAELATDASTLAVRLKEMRHRSISGEGNLQFGMRASGGGNSYELFSTPGLYEDENASIIETVFMASGVRITDPASGNREFIFSRRSGTTTSGSITLATDGMIRTISVTSRGVISIQ